MYLYQLQTKQRFLCKSDGIITAAFYAHPFREKQRPTTLIALANSVKAMCINVLWKKMLFWRLWRNFWGEKGWEQGERRKKMVKTLWKLETSRKWLKGYLDNAAMRDDTQSISACKERSLLAVSYKHYLSGMKKHIN